MSIFEQQRQQFILANGGEYIWVECFGNVFSNGAVMGQDVRGPYESVPRDERSRKHNIMLFHKAHLARAVVLFNELKYKLEQKALAAIKSGGALVTDEELDRLEKLQEDVNQKRETLEAIQSRLRPAQRAEEASTIAARHKHQQEASESLNRLKSMRV